MKIQLGNKSVTIGVEQSTMNKSLNAQLTHTVKISAPTSSDAKYGNKVTLLRHALGEDLRRRRVAQGRTLRDVSRTAQVSLGYLSELERGQKEASSELLAAICTALNTPLSEVLQGVAVDIARHEAALNRRLSVVGA